MGRKHWLSAALAVFVTTSGWIAVDASGASAALLVVGSCRALESQTGNEQTLVANPRTTPCRADDTGLHHHVITVGVPGLVFTVEVYEPQSFTLNSTDAGPDVEAFYQSAATTVALNGVPIVSTQEVNVNAVERAAPDCSNREGFGGSELNIVNSPFAFFHDADESTRTIAPGVRLHRNYRQQTATSVLVRGIWIENLPAKTVDIVVGEAYAGLLCTNVDRG